MYSFSFILGSSWAGDRQQSLLEKETFYINNCLTLRNYFTQVNLILVTQFKGLKIVTVKSKCTCIYFCTIRT